MDEQLSRAITELTARYEDKVEELSLVRQLGDALGSSLDLKTVCARTVDLLNEALTPEHCSLMLLEADGLVLAAARGAYDSSTATFEAAAEAVRFIRGEGVAGQVAVSGQALRVDDTEDDPRFVARPGEVKPRSLLCLPLTARGRVVGVINLSDSVPGAFEARHERILAIIANSVGMAVENARLFAEVNQGRERLATENRALKRALEGRFTFGGLVGESPAFRRVLSLLERVADTSATVLITGESGTGKEVIARTLHHNSPRKEGPFVAVNCAALPENLLEAELFGIERGVATGVDARPGTFEQAHGGTLFLDEVGDMSPAVQVRLLRAVQERQVTRLGGRRPVDVDVRLVSATHRDLAAQISAGRFREDLYYRLKVVQVHVPPLRERREDILPLAEHFAEHYAKRHQRPSRPVGRAAARALWLHPFPGNVRELEHALEQAVLLADGPELTPDDLGLKPEAVSGVRVELPDDAHDLPQVLAQVIDAAERQLIARALADCGGNRTHAALRLGLSRRALLYKLERLDLR